MSTDWLLLRPYYGKYSVNAVMLTCKLLCHFCYAIKLSCHHRIYCANAVWIGFANYCIIWLLSLSSVLCTEWYDGLNWDAVILCQRNVCGLANYCMRQLRRGQRLQFVSTNKNSCFPPLLAHKRVWAGFWWSQVWSKYLRRKQACKPRSYAM